MRHVLLGLGLGVGVFLAFCLAALFLFGFFYLGGILFSLGQWWGFGYIVLVVSLVCGFILAEMVRA